MKRFLLILGLLYLVIGAQAQTKYTISGEVVDSTTGKGVEYATVSVTDSTSKALAAAV